MANLSFWHTRPNDWALFAVGLAYLQRGTSHLH